MHVIKMAVLMMVTATSIPTLRREPRSSIGERCKLNRVVLAGCMNSSYGEEKMFRREVKDALSGRFLISGELITVPAAADEGLS
jgi:hypothetical protein